MTIRSVFDSLFCTSCKNPSSGILGPKKDVTNNPILKNKPRTKRILEELMSNTSFLRLYDEVQSLYSKKISILSGSERIFPPLKNTDCYVQIRELFPTIVYKESITDKEVKLSIIVELSNALFKSEHLSLDKLYKNKSISKNEFVTKSEVLEWQALNRIKPLIEEIVPTVNPYSERIFKDLQYCLDQQSNLSHNNYTHPRMHKTIKWNTI